MAVSRAERKIGRNGIELLPRCHQAGRMTPVGAESNNICIRQADLGVPAVHGRMGSGRQGDSPSSTRRSPDLPIPAQDRVRTGSGALHRVHEDGPAKQEPGLTAIVDPKHLARSLAEEGVDFRRARPVFDQTPLIGATVAAKERLRAPTIRLREVGEQCAPFRAPFGTGLSDASTTAVAIAQDRENQNTGGDHVGPGSDLPQDSIGRRKDLNKRAHVTDGLNSRDQEGCSQRPSPPSAGGSQVIVSICEPQRNGHGGQDWGQNG